MKNEKQCPIFCGWWGCALRKKTSSFGLFYLFNKDTEDNKFCVLVCVWLVAGNRAKRLEETVKSTDKREWPKMLKTYYINEPRIMMKKNNDDDDERSFLSCQKNGF